MHSDASSDIYLALALGKSLNFTGPSFHICKIKAMTLRLPISESWCEVFFLKLQALCRLEPLLFAYLW